MELALCGPGLEIETATTDDDGPGARRADSAGRQVSGNGVVRWYFPKNTEFYKVSWPFVPWILREVRRFDLVHIHGVFSFTSVVAAWAARRAGVPYLVRPLGALSLYGVTRRRPLLKRISLRLVEGPLLRGAAAVHFTSEPERDEALELGVAMKPIVIPLGIDAAPPGDADRFLSARSHLRSKVRLLYLSRLDPKKNVEGVIRALKVLRQEGVQPALLVGGSGDAGYVESLHALARTEGVDDQVHWLGPVSGELKADILAAANLFLLPSFSENFGIAAIEALAAGLPCVLGRGVAVAARVEEAGAGITVDPDPLAIAAGVRYFLDSGERCSRAGEAGRRLVESDYSLERMGTRLIELYRSVAAQHRR